MYSQSTLVDDEVILLAVGGVEVDVHRNLKLLVVRLVHQVHVAHDPHHALAHCPQLVDVNVCALVVHHLVLFEQHHHLVACRAVHHIVRQFLIITQRTVVHTHVTHLHVRTLARDLDVRGFFLEQRVRRGILLRAA